MTNLEFAESLRTDLGKPWYFASADSRRGDTVLMSRQPGLAAKVAAAKQGKTAKLVKHKNSYRKRPPMKEYKAFIASQPCIVGRRNFVVLCDAVEVAHVGERGLSQKSSHLETLPICTKHHRDGMLSLHQLGKQFWSYWNLDKEQLIKEFQELYASSVSHPIA